MHLARIVFERLDPVLDVGSALGRVVVGFGRDSSLDSWPSWRAGEAECRRDFCGRDDREAAVQRAGKLLFGVDGECAFAVFEGDFGDGHKGPPVSAPGRRGFG